MINWTGRVLYIKTVGEEPTMMTQGHGPLPNWEVWTEIEPLEKTPYLVKKEFVSILEWEREFERVAGSTIVVPERIARMTAFKRLARKYNCRLVFEQNGYLVVPN